MNDSAYVLTTLSKNPEYFEQVIALIEEEFGYSPKQNYEIDFAPLMNPFNFENCYLYIEASSGALAAHLAVCPRTLIKNETTMNVAFIGGIATHKAHRGKNLFKNLMNIAIEEHREKCALFILWSDLENIYEKFSFHRAGGFFESGNSFFPQSSFPGFEKTHFSDLNKEDFAKIKNLYKQFNERQFFTVKREEMDWSLIRDMKSVDLYIKRLDNNIDRYFCVNKGKDLTGIIHEVSASSKAVYQNLIKEIGQYRVWLPESEPHSGKDIYFSSFFKMGSLKILNAFLKDTSQGDLSIVSANEGKVIFDFNLKQFEVTEREFLHYLFGPKPLVEFAPYSLSLYVCGLDSV